jgi:hypothetical protein
MESNKFEFSTLHFVSLIYYDFLKNSIEIYIYIYILIKRLNFRIFLSISLQLSDNRVPDLYIYNTCSYELE